MRVFLDANVLFFAAYREKNGILRLWELKKLRLVTSAYALKEAERNLAHKRPEALSRFATLAAGMEIAANVRHLRDAHGLPEKDLPILEAAAGAKCEALLTGDMAHFGHLIGKTAAGVNIMTVRMLLTAMEK